MVVSMPNWPWTFLPQHLTGRNCHSRLHRYGGLPHRCSLLSKSIRMILNRSVLVATRGPDLAMIIPTPTLDYSCVGKATSMLITESDRNHCLSLNRCLCWSIFTGMVVVATTEVGRGAITKLPVAITTPTVYVRVNCSYCEHVL